MTASLTDTLRPNGKVYRPKKAPSVETFFDRNDYEAVVVLRTHDFDLALKLAADWIDAMELQPDKAYEDWWRLVPYDANCSGHDRTWVTDTVRGVPCVVIPYE